MAEQLPGEEVGGRVSVEFHTTSDTYAAHWRTINQAIAAEFAGLLDGEAAVDPAIDDPRRQLIRGEATEGEQSLPRPRERGEGVGGQVTVGQVDRAEAVRRVIAKWAPRLDPSHPAVAAYLARLVEESPELKAALRDCLVDLPLDLDEP
jgi:hypothetical protein